MYVLFIYVFIIYTPSPLSFHTCVHRCQAQCQTPITDLNRFDNSLSVKRQYNITKLEWALGRAHTFAYYNIGH